MKRYFILMAVAFSTTLLHGQTVTTFAGKVNDVDPWTNFNNTACSAADAYFYEPMGICWDPNGNMYTSERNKIRIYYNNNFNNRSGKLGDGQFSHGFRDGTGIVGELYAPSSIICDASGNLIIVDNENHAIRKLTPFSSIANGQILSTMAGAAPPSGLGGQGVPGNVNGTGNNARFDSPKGITMDKNGNFYITDYNNFSIRKMTAAGVVTTLAGTGADGSADGTIGTNSSFGGPWGIAMLDDNNVVICDQFNSSIRKVNISSGKTTTLCGKVGEAIHKDGTLAEARFRDPQGIAVVDGLIYVTDFSCIRVIDLTKGTVSTFAGSGSAQGNTNGNGTAARFGKLNGIYSDGKSNLFVTDIYYNLIKKVSIDNLAPGADFTATKVSLLVNEEATLTDASTGKSATSRKWTVTNSSGNSTNVVIVNGDPNASASLTVKFAATGFYNVKLEVTNEYGTDSKTSNSYFNVSTTGVATQISAKNGLLIYPNPSNGEFVLNGANFDLNHAVVTIQDMTGKVVKSFSDLSGTSNLNVKDLNSGFYTLTLIQEGHRYYQKIQIQ